MNSLLTKKIPGTINYYQKGTKPVLLLLSGTHGDEYGVIDPLKKTIDKYLDKLPDFVFIPEVSPTAVKLKTRRNEFDNDVNRNFFENTDDPEAKSVMDIVAKYKFKLGVSFHEDIEYDSFYMYDSQKMNSDLLNNFKTKVKKLGIGLYSGVDDIHDVTLGVTITNGYFAPSQKSTKITNGDFWEWSLINEYVKRLLYPEIPGNLPLKDKIFLVGLIFKDLIFPILKLK